MDVLEITALQWQVATNNERAFRDLFLYFYPRLVSFSAKFVYDRQVCEELVSDILMKIWTQREKLQAINNLSVYLFISAKNASLNYLSWKSRDLITYVENYPENLSVGNLTPENQLLNTEMMKRMEQAVAALPPKCRLIFTMVRDYGLKYKEVGTILGISERTVDTQMTIANKKLAGAIALIIPHRSK